MQTIFLVWSVLDRSTIQNECWLIVWLGWWWWNKNAHTRTQDTPEWERERATVYGSTESGEWVWFVSEWDWVRKKPWNGGLLLAVELVGESRPGRRSGIGVTTGHVKPRRCWIPCSFIVSLLSDSVRFGGFGFFYLCICSRAWCTISMHPHTHTENWLKFQFGFLNWLIEIVCKYKSTNCFYRSEH